MTTEETMRIHERRRYVRTMRARYFPADRAERGQLLTEMAGQAVSSIEILFLV